MIQRFTINADGTLGAPQNITTIQTSNGGNRAAHRAWRSTPRRPPTI